VTGFGGEVWEEATSARVHFNHPGRLLLLPGGISRRKEKFLHTYCLDCILPEEQASLRVVVDVGCNVGELGIYLPRATTYVGIDPDSSVKRPFELNNPEGIFIGFAISNIHGERDIFVSPESGDTGFHSRSLASGVQRVDTETVDRVIESLEDFPDVIDLLKVEAEGHEPEVLQGALRILTFTRYVAIDFGPEREGECTDEACMRILANSGFQKKNRRGNRAIFQNLNL
jgi:FkbM family methyltransferase